MGADAQLFLDFPRADPARRPVIDTGAYRAPMAALQRWQAWPEKQLAIVGDAGAGKSRLAAWWAIETGAAVVTGEALAAADISTIAGLSVAALAVDDADMAGSGGGADGRGLLAALNMCRAKGTPVLLTGQGQPAGWFGEPLDLRSRLQAMPVAEIGAPDDETLLRRLLEECAQRHLNLPDGPALYLAQRMPRSWPAVTLVADQVERTRGRAFTLPAARRVLEALGLNAG